MDEATERKWDRVARRFDLMNGSGPEKRWQPIKEELFSHMGDGRILFLAIGTGLDIAFFPPGRNIVALDISTRMIEQARPRARAYPGKLELRHLDVHDLDEPEGSYDQVFTSCTFCSVPDPVGGLQKLHQVLAPGGELWMFEHTGSRYIPFKWMLDAMTLFSRLVGPDLNRPTVENVQRAGFEVREVRNHFLDVVKTIHAVKPSRS